MFVAGMVGSFVGGTIFGFIAGDGFNIGLSGLIGSTIGAIIVLAIYGPLRSRLRPSTVKVEHPSTIKPKKH